MISFLGRICITATALIILHFSSFAYAYDFSALDKAMQKYVTQGNLAGNTLLVTKHGVPIYHKSFGLQDIESEQPMRVDTIYRIASQTKALTSVSIMILRERGLLDLNDPLSKYVPGWKNSTVMIVEDGKATGSEAAKREITLFDLITHTAGISYGWGPMQNEYEAAGVLSWYFADEDNTVAGVLEALPSLPQAAQPGEQFVYGHNTDILGVVVEVVSGKTLGQFMHDEITQPLGMHDTAFFLPPAKIDRLASVYNATETGLQKAPAPGHMLGQGHYVDGPKKAEAGGAGLLSTAGDYTRFLQMMLNGGELDGTRILSKESVTMMRSPQIGDIPFSDGQSFGLGFSVVLDPVAAKRPAAPGSYGWGGAYHTNYFVDPANGITFTYMTQLIPAMDLDETSEITEALYQALQ